MNPGDQIIVPYTTAAGERRYTTGRFVDFSPDGQWVGYRLEIDAPDGTPRRIRRSTFVELNGATDS